MIPEDMVSGGSRVRRLNRLTFRLVLFISVLGALFVSAPNAAAQVPSGCVASRTFYIDFSSGSDANNGTSKATPWKRQPYMPGWTGTYTHAARDCFIFKGGVTWPNSVFTGNGLDILAGGAAGNPDYYGVDQTWFSGASWVRPIFSGRATPLSSSSQAIIVIEGGSNYIIFDNIEMTGVYVPTASQGAGGAEIIYVRGPTHDLTFQNLDVHGWYVQQTNTTPPATDQAYGGIMHNAGGIAVNVDNVLITFCKIHNTDGGLLNLAGTAIQYPKVFGAGFWGIQKITHSELYDMSAGFFVGGEIMAYNNIHDLPNLSNACPGCSQGSQNTAGVWQWQGLSTAITRPAFVHHNLIKNSQANTGLYASPSISGPPAVTMYVYDNVIMGSEFAHNFDASAMGALASGGNPFDIYYYNNTTEITNFNCIYNANRAPDGPVRTATLKNNHCVIDGAIDLQLSATQTIVTSNNVTQNHTTATSQGYTASNKYAPTAPANSTVAAGVNNPTCPGCPDFNLDFNGVVRPASGPWDVGAYQFVGSRPNPPTNLTVTVP